MKLSKEEDLKALEKLGYIIYDDMEKAKSKLFDNMSSSNRNKALEMFMYSFIAKYATEFTDLKRIIGKCDYMKRCSNTNDKCIIVIAFLYAEYMTFCDYTGMKAKTKEMLDYYTEEKVYPSYGRVLTSKDIMDSIHNVAMDSFGKNFYKAVQDYVASMIYYYNL